MRHRHGRRPLFALCAKSTPGLRPGELLGSLRGGIAPVASAHYSTCLASLKLVP